MEDSVLISSPNHKATSRTKTRTSVWDFDLTVKLVQLRLGEFDSSFKACGSNVNDRTRSWEDISWFLGIGIKSSEVAKKFRDLNGQYTTKKIIENRSGSGSVNWFHMHVSIVLWEKDRRKCSESIRDGRRIANYFIGSLR